MMEPWFATGLARDVHIGGEMVIGFLDIALNVRAAVFHHGFSVT